MDIDAFHEAIHALLRDVSQRAILPHYQMLAAHQVTEKAVDDVVTVADHLAEEMLEEGLAKIVPGLAVVGEEAAHEDASVLEKLSGEYSNVQSTSGCRAAPSLSSRAPLTAMSMISCFPALNTCSRCTGDVEL